MDGHINQFGRIRRSKRTITINAEKLEEDSTNTRIREEIHENLKEKSLKSTQTSQEDWRKIKGTSQGVTENYLNQKTCKKNQPWMTEKILNMMEERRKYRDKN